MDVELLNLIMLLAYVVGLVLALVRIAARRLRYAILGEKSPALLSRDLWFVTGLAFPFLAILTVRVVIAFFPGLGLSTMLQGNQLWYLITGLPAIIAVWAFVYYEYFRIEKSENEKPR